MGPASVLRGVVTLCAILLGSSTIGACGPRAPRVVPPAERAEAEAVLERYVEWRLAPARIAPPTLRSRSEDAEAAGVRGHLELVFAEEAPWNEWPGPTARLFNNRTAHLFDIRLDASGPVRWLPERTLLELNAPGNVFRPAASQEVLLEELLFWAYHQERSVIPGDLVERTRGAGALRDAYLPAQSTDGVLGGVLAFPLEVTVENAPFYGEHDDPADLHVVAMRVTLGIEGPDGVGQLVWELE